MLYFYSPFNWLLKYSNVQWNFFCIAAEISGSLKVPRITWSAIQFLFKVKKHVNCMVFRSSNPILAWGPTIISWLINFEEYGISTRLILPPLQNNLLAVLQKSITVCVYQVFKPLYGTSICTFKKEEKVI